MSKLQQSISTTFRSLKYKNFRYFWIGQCVSLIGTFMQRTAQVWLVFTLTNSPLLVGILGVCQFMPMMLFSLFAGAIVDRFPKKRILLMTQLVYMLQALLMTFLTFTGMIQYWHVFILSAVYGIVTTIDMPARQSFFYELVGKEDILNAISLNSTIANLAKILGPAAAGLVMVTFGPVVCFFSNALSYIAVIGGILLINIKPLVVQKIRKNIFSEAMDGLRYIRQNEVLIINVLIMAVVCTLAMNYDVIVPVFAAVALGKGAVGYTALLSAAGFGSFIAAIALAFISKNGLRKRRLIFAAAATSVLQIVTFFIPQYSICILLLVLIGFSNLTFFNTANAIFQINSSDEYRGRVMSVYTFLMAGSTPVGNFFAGVAMQHFGGSSGFIVCGATTLLLLIPVFILKHRTIAEWMKSEKLKRPV